MSLLIFILIFCFVVFLFALHVLAKEDLVLVRKNINMETLFNLAFYTAGVGLLSARIIYILLHFSVGFLNPLVFFLFPYFPGLSLVGGVGGALIFISTYKMKKYPTGRIFDFFSMALLASLPFGFLGEQLLVGMQDKFVGLLMPVIFLSTLLFFVKVLVPLNMRGEIKDGSLGFLFLIIFSFIELLSYMVRAKDIFSLLVRVDSILLMLLFIFSLAKLVAQERDIHLGKKI